MEIFAFQHNLKEHIVIVSKPWNPFRARRIHCKSLTNPVLWKYCFARETHMEQSGLPWEYIWEHFCFCKSVTPWFSTITPFLMYCALLHFVQLWLEHKKPAVQFPLMPLLCVARRAEPGVVLPQLNTGPYHFDANGLQMSRAWKKLCV